MAARSIPSAFPKFWLKLGASLITITGLYWFTVNLWAERKLPYIESAISMSIKHPVTIEKAHYNLFMGFLLDGVEIKKDVKSSTPIRIERVRAIPAFILAPKPTIRIYKIIFERPHILLRGKSEFFFKACTRLRDLPMKSNQIGLLALEVKLSSFEVREGEISIVLLESKKPWRQDFEGVHFFAGQHWFSKNFSSLSGHIAGRPNAGFRVECDIKNPSKKEFNSNIRIDFHEFTAAYLNPHLGDRFKLPDKDLTATMKFKIRAGHAIEAKGKIRLPEIPVKGTLFEKFMNHSPAFQYSLKGVWNDGHGIFPSVSLKSRDIEFKGKGEILFSQKDSHYYFSLSSSKVALTKFKNLLKPFKPDSGQVKLGVVFKGDEKRFEPSLVAVLYNCALFAEDSNLSVTKLEGRVGLSKSAVEVKEIWAFVNNLPFRLNGRLIREGRPHFQFEFSTYPGQLASLKSKNALNVSVKAAGIKLRSGWSGYLKCMRDDFRAQIPQQIVCTAAFHNISPVGNPEKNGWANLWRGVRWRCGSFNLKHRVVGMTDQTSEITLTRLYCLITADSQHAQIHLASAAFCGGKFTAKGGVDFHHFLWQMNATLVNADVPRVLRYLKKDYPLTGRLAFNASFKGMKDVSLLELHFKLTNGLIGPSPALIRWAEQTGVEALKCIRYRAFSGEVLHKNNVWELRDIRLESDQAHLQANLKLKSKIVSGLLSVKFPVSSIRDSSDLKWLLRFVHAADWVDFDFKIAGYLTAPRVEWLGGEFKKKVGSALAPWMKVKFDEIIEKKLSERPMIAS